MTMYLANDYKLLQDAYERRSVWHELPIDQDLVRSLHRWCVRLLATERNYPIFQSENPASRSKRDSVTAIMSIEHDRSAVSKVVLHHIFSTVAEDLKPGDLFQVV